MQKLARFLPALVLFAFVLFFPAETRADPLVITGGTVFIGGAVNSRNAWRAFSINFSGQNVQVNVGVGDGDSTRRPASPCTNGPCQPGAMVSPNVSFSAEGIGSATVNGTEYSAWFFGRDTLMTFTGDSVPFPQFDPSSSAPITLTTNFLMTGTLVIHDLNANNNIVFTTPITGQGTASFVFTFLNLGAGTGYWMSSVTYTFSAPAQTPEPATLLLLGTGLAGAASYRRRRRRAAH
jgi:hypothetical protein